MHIEKINDHKIRCFVTASDLMARKLTIKELKYGNQATMDLFHDVVEEASSRYGFNEEEFPIMIEAVPIGPDGLMITVSAIEEAEEMDPHFARFTPFEEENTKPRYQDRQDVFSTDDPRPFTSAVFSFSGIDDVMAFTLRVSEDFSGKSLLYRNTEQNGFYLTLQKPETLSVKDFRTFVNSLSEFGEFSDNSQVLFAYLSEHQEPVMKDPLTVLRRL